MEINNRLFKINFKQLSYLSYAILIFWALLNIFTPEQYRILTRLFNFIIIPSGFVFIFALFQGYINKGKISYNSGILLKMIGGLLAFFVATIGGVTQLVIVIRTLIVLFFLLFYLHYRNELSQNQKLNLSSFFYWSFFVFIIFNLFLYGELNPDFFFPSTMDKNYTGILFYFLLMLSIHRKNIVGIFISCIYILLMTQSRSLYGMIAIYFLVKIFKTPIYNIIQTLHLKKTFKQFFLLLIGILCLSSFWIQCIAINPLSQYREGLNDGSNKMRFAANIYAEQQLINNPQYFYKGLGDHIKETFGVADKDFSTHTRFMGVRLVQPHNCFLNMMLKIGIFEALIYFWLLGTVLDKIWSRDNIEYYIPYLVNACFMHSLLDGPYLVIWSFVLMATQENANENTNGVKSCYYKIKMPFSISWGRFF